MTYNATINLGTVSANITHVNLQLCDIDCNSCTPLQNYQNVPIGFFPLTIYNINESITTIKVIVSNGDCVGQEQCLPLLGV